MPFEDEFSRALRATADAAAPPPVELMAAGAARRGRRHKRRRAVVAGAASVAVLAAGGALALQLRPHQVDPAASVASSASAGLPTGPIATSGDTVKPQSSPPPPPEQLALLLKDKLLGANLAISGSATTDHGPDLDYQEMTAAWTAIDSRGSGLVKVILHRGPTKPDLTSKVFACAANVPCTRTAQADGAYLLVQQLPYSAGGQQMWAAELQRPDGVTITVVSSNLPGPGAKVGNGPTRDAPVLSLAQLSAFALDPVWDQVVARLG